MDDTTERTSSATADWRSSLNAACEHDEGDNRLQTAPPGSKLARIPFVLGRITLIGGKPGSGKTSLVYQLAFDSALAGDDGFTNWNAEMSSRDLWRKQLSRLSGVPVADIPPHKKDFDESLQYARDQLSEIEEYVEFLSPDFSLKRIYEHGCTGRLLLIDYVQRLRIDGISDSRARIDCAMSRFRELARDDRAIVVVSSLSRGTSGMESFRESSELEFGCDYAYLMEKTGDSSVLLTNVKNRWGALRDVVLSVDWPTMTFSDRGATECDDVAGNDNPQVWQPPTKRGPK